MSNNHLKYQIGNLNNPLDNDLGASQSINGPNSDEGWYPVPIKNASDYHEQLDQILPSQYELLLKKIMRKYKINQTTLSNKNVIKTSPLWSLILK